MPLQARVFTHFTRGALLGSLIIFWLFWANAAQAMSQYAVTPQFSASVAVMLERAIRASGEDEQLIGLYRNRSFRPIWVGDDEAQRRSSALRNFVVQIVDEGLNAHDYVLPAQPVQHALAAAAFDLAMSINLLTVVEDVTHGRIRPDELGIEWDIARDDGDTVTIARRLVASPNMAIALNDLLPQHRHYQDLRAAYSHYLALSANGGWEVVPDDYLLKKGVVDERVVALRRRLITENDHAGLIQVERPELFDATVEQAVIAFQRQYGLDDDGIVGRATLAAMNVTAAQRAAQIAINLERWRWLPRDLGERHILVNSADFTLGLFDQGESILDMRVVVGKTYRQTPVLSKNMKYLVLNPTWTVPPGILRKDILPKLKTNPNYLQDKGMQVFEGWDASAVALNADEVDWSRVSVRHSPYKVQQAAGSQNALGQVKFMFPNQHSVYLHDTPSRSLFGERVRAFSSGCVRLERPLELASALMGLGGEGRSTDAWTDNTLQSALASGETSNVILENPVPVHLTYLTAWTNVDGRVQFRDDIYNRDTRLQLALNDQFSVAANSN
ncbi:MAG: L,D-transpeptidase family protein [Pseudomonadota bacterium]